MPPPSAALETPTQKLLDRFALEAFGFWHDDASWRRDFPDGTRAAFVRLGWEHVHTPSYDLVDGRREPTDALEFVLSLQARTWGMPPDLLVPKNILAILPDSGGACLVAYDLEKGFNADGWLAFAIALGGRSGTLVSHMVGVREDLRGRQDHGFFMKVFQAHEALRTGHDAMIWTFDPMRGGNARLNIEKLGATVEELTLDKYGALQSELYGDVPSDRFTAHWKLDERTADRLTAVYDGRYRGLAPEDVAALPEATPATVGALAAARTPRLICRVPGDVDALMRTAPDRAVRWRQEVRAILSHLLSTKSAVHADEAGPDPRVTRVQKRPGAYVVGGFATGLDAAGERISYYVLERRAE